MTLCIAIKPKLVDTLIIAAILPQGLDSDCKTVSVQSDLHDISVLCQIAKMDDVGLQEIA